MSVGGADESLSKSGPLGPPTRPSEELSATDVLRHEQTKVQLSQCTAIVFDFLQSKGLFTTERALRTELELGYQREASLRSVLARNLWHSKLEKMLHVKLPRSGEGDCSPEMAVLLSEAMRVPSGSRHGTPTNWGNHNALDHAGGAGASSRSTPSRRLGVRLHNLHPSLGEEEGQLLRKQRSRSAQQSCVVFREGTPLTEAEAASVETLALPLLYNPYLRGLEDSPELPIDEDTLVAGRYRVNTLIGKGSFSRVVQCYDQKERRSVSLKVLHNDKDCVDQVTALRPLLPLPRARPRGAHSRRRRSPSFAGVCAAGDR